MTRVLKSFLLFAAVGFCTISCSKYDTVTTSSTESSARFYATFDVDSKVSVSNDLEMSWNAGDEISVFGNPVNDKYRFNGKDGDIGGTFSRVASGDPKYTYPRFYTLYPYMEGAECTGEGVFSVNVPSVQQYIEGSFDTKADMLAAVSQDIKDDKLKFRHSFCFIKFRLYCIDTVKVTSLVFKGNNNENLCGAATITVSTDAAPVLDMTSATGKQITVDCGSGVALGTIKSKPTSFWIVLPPTTFSKGFTLTVKTDKGKSVDVTTSKKIAIGRAQALPINAVGIFTKKKPVIGVGFGNAHPEHFPPCVEDAGGIYKLIPLVSTKSEAEAEVAKVDGVIIPGEGPSGNGRTYEYDHNLILAAHAAGKPVLGICRGHQRIDVAFGGVVTTLTSFISKPINHSNIESQTHVIDIDEDSGFYSIMKVTPSYVNSNHTWAIKTLATNLKAVAWASDGTIEAVEEKGVLGVQYHPERLYLNYTDEQSLRIFEWLVSEARKCMKTDPNSGESFEEEPGEM